MNSVSYLNKRENERKRGKVATQDTAESIADNIEMVDMFGQSGDLHFSKIEPRIHAQVVFNNVNVWTNYYVNILGIHNFYNCLCFLKLKGQYFCTEFEEKKI